MGQQVKCPQKMKAPDSFRNPGLWCDFHRDHGHKTEDCIALKIEVNELLKKGHLWDGISHAAAKKSTWNAKQALEAAKPKRLHLDTDKISFTTKEQERVLSPHHDALVISFTVANCLVKRILVDNGSSGNIIFQAAYKDLGLEKSALTRRITPLIGFSGEVKQTAGEVHSIGSFPFSRRKGLVPGTGPGVLSSGDPGRLLVGTQRPVSCMDSGRMLYQSIFPQQFAPYYSILSSNSGNNLCTQVNRSCSSSAGFP
ncbi:hypothetical protein DY000_02014293 [Brassica cretica]|uniref:Uncharacterized protein n=1 Tax=Brassica cretica TaxID=69181 RepID=A0ABQ7DC50_BRACR|nr:hypothetical protein DY000_02014293 [Brassica cretica]